MHLPKSIIANCAAIALLLGGIDPVSLSTDIQQAANGRKTSGGDATFGNPSSSAEFLILDGVKLVVHADQFPSEAFTLPAPGAADQVASSIAWKPFRELSITAIPFGRGPGTESLPHAASGGQRSYEAALRSYRVQQGGKVQDGPSATLFGKPVIATQSVVEIFIDGPAPKPVVIDEWVVEALDRIWLVRASQEQVSDALYAPSASSAQALTVESQGLVSSSGAGNSIAGTPLQASGSAAAVANLPTPVWWNGDCDFNTYSAKSGVGSYRLGAVYLGMPACGPRPSADGGPDVLVRFFSGAWGEYEWECVELTMRFLYLMYGISPYQANGSQVVWNYPGSRLIKVANGSVGRAPQPNDVLSYGATSTFGHASVVTASSVDANGNGTITVIEENNSASGSSTLSVNNWLVSGNAGAISGWLHDASTDTGNVKVTINNTAMGTYNVGSFQTMPLTYPGTINGPVQVVSTDGKPILPSQRVIYLNSGYYEIMGYPASQLTTQYWFPWYDNVNMRTWVLVGNPDASQTAQVDINIGGTNMGHYSIPPGGRITPVYSGIVNGPVQVVSTNGITIFTSERVIYQNSAGEVMGYPANRFTTEYWFTWYDNVNMRTWVLVGNPDPSRTATVDINIAGNNMGHYSIPPGGRITPVYSGIVNGPVQVLGTNGVTIFTSERVIYQGSEAEVMGYPASQFGPEYWFPRYDQVSMQTWLLVGNPDPLNSVTVDITIGSHVAQSYTIPAGGRITPQYAGVVDGPVHIASRGGNIFASQRDIYQGSEGEVLGYPASQLTTQYWFTWYDDYYMNSSLYVAHP